MDITNWVLVQIHIPTRTQQAVLNEELSCMKAKQQNRSDDSFTKQNLEEFDPNCLSETSLVQIVEKYIIENEIEDEWTQYDENLVVRFHYHVSRVEELVNFLDQTGIGQLYSSCYRITPCLAYRSSKSASSLQISGENTSSEDGSDFLKVTKPEVSVQQILNDTRVAATINFDYTVLLLCSALMAATGLLENNSQILVASILVSPVMGPVLAGTFGFSLGDEHLWKHSVTNELVSLSYCLLLGFLYGLVYSNISSWNNGVFVTEIMKSRGRIHSLLFNFIVAIPSGMGVALSVLGNKAGPLVGVGISTSLLPPVVNAGLLFAFSLVETFTGNVTLPSGYDPIYSTLMNEETACLAGVSICLTLVSIICIVAMTLLILKTKRLTTKQSLRFFKNIWTKDLPAVKHKLLQVESGSELTSDGESYKSTVDLTKLFGDASYSSTDTSEAEMKTAEKNNKAFRNNGQSKTEPPDIAVHPVWQFSTRSPFGNFNYIQQPEERQRLVEPESFKFYGSL